MQLFVHTQELHTLQVTGQESLAQIKAHLALLESVAPEDKVLLLTGTSLEDEAPLEALSTLEVAGHMLGGKKEGRREDDRTQVKERQKRRELMAQIL
uniref:Ubiquitin-like domain-containing protein n=1 Tax=Bos indicus x Bos taurus TaxID=30522 RepID=A0A4W2I1T6_BOBOX